MYSLKYIELAKTSLGTNITDIWHTHKPTGGAEPSKHSGTCILLTACVLPVSVFYKGMEDASAIRKQSILPYTY